MPLAAFALAWFAYRFGIGPSAGLAIVASLPMALSAPLVASHPFDALFVAATLLAVGPGAAWALERFPAYTVAAAIALISGVAFVLVPLGHETLTQSITFWTTVLKVALKNQGMDAASIAAGVQSLRTQMGQAWTSSAIYTMGFGALLSVPLVARAGRAFGRPTNRYPAIAETDLSFHFVWPTIAGLALLAAGMAWQHGTGMAYAVGFNLLMVVRPALFLQGLAVFAMLYRRMKAGPVWRVTGLILLGLTELVVPSVSVLGAVDLFANVRKLPRAHAQS
jgi:uncharacterized protein YybS (DUF2232 family)